MEQADSFYKISWSDDGINFLPSSIVNCETYMQAYRNAENLNKTQKRFVQIHKHDPNGDISYIVTFRRGIPDSRPMSEILKLEESLPTLALEKALSEGQRFIEENYVVVKTWEKKNYAIVAAKLKGSLQNAKPNYFVIETKESMNSGFFERHKEIEKKVGKFLLVGPLDL